MASFHRALQDDLSAFESKGRKPTEAEAYDIVNGAKDTAIKSGWLKVSDRHSSSTTASDTSDDDAFHEHGVQVAQAEPPAQPTQNGFSIVGLPKDFETFHRQREEVRQRKAGEQAAAGTGGAPGAPAMDLDPGGLDYRDADAQARAVVAQLDAEGTGGQGGPQVEPPPGSPEHQAAEKEARRVADRQEAVEREADRMTTHWLVQKTEDGSPPKLPPILAERLSPAEKEELEALAVTPDTPTDPEVYNRILRNLLNYNSGVRLKWAREPLFRYRKFFSGENFAKLALIQSRLDPDTGQVSGFAPVPADLVSLYDWLAPEPDWEYGTILPIKHTADWKYRDWALPSSARSFFKGMLDLLAAQKTGELTTDALESFMTLHSVGGRAFGLRGGEGTLAAGGKRRIPKPPPGLTIEQRRLFYFGAKHNLQWSSPTNQRVLANLDTSAQDFIGAYRAGRVNAEFPGEFEGLSVPLMEEDPSTVWFSRAELGFMIAATERALKELHVDEFDTRTGRTIDYAKGVLAGLRVANGERALPRVPQADDRVPNSKEADTSRRLRVTIRVERIADDKALVSLSDHELRFLNNAINEAIHGIRGVEEFEQISGKTDEYGRKLMRQLQAANDKVEDLN